MSPAESEIRIGVPRESSRLSEEQLSALVHKIGHEIGNPLTAIISLATIIERFARESQKSDLETQAKKNSHYAASIIDEAWKIGALSERLVILLSQKVGNIVPCELKRILEKVIQKRELRLRIPGDRVVMNVLGEQPIVAAIDPEHLSILIAEILNNAHSTLLYDFPEDAASRPTTVMLRNEQNHCILTITNDSRTAFPSELSLIFEPFQTTRGEHKHLGLGLPMCQAIASRYGGTLRAIEQAKRDIFSFTLELTLPRAKNE